MKAEISHVLLKTHIKQLKKEGKWPKEFDNDEEAAAVKETDRATIDDNEDEEQYSSDESLNLEENPNHAAYAEVEDEESDSDESSEDEEENSEELDGKNA